MPKNGSDIHGIQGRSMEIAASDCLPSFEVDVHEEGAVPVAWEGNGTSMRSPFPAVVTMNRELHQAGSDRSCLHVELDINGSEVHLPAMRHMGAL